MPGPPQSGAWLDDRTLAERNDRHVHSHGFRQLVRLQQKLRIRRLSVNFVPHHERRIDQNAARRENLLQNREQRAVEIVHHDDRTESAAR